MTASGGDSVAPGTIFHIQTFKPELLDSSSNQPANVPHIFTRQTHDPIKSCIQCADVVFDPKLSPSEDWIELLGVRILVLYEDLEMNSSTHPNDKEKRANATTQRCTPENDPAPPPPHTPQTTHPTPIPIPHTTPNRHIATRTPAPQRGKGGGRASFREPGSQRPGPCSPILTAFTDGGRGKFGRYLGWRAPRPELSETHTHVWESNAGNGVERGGAGV